MHNDYLEHYENNHISPVRQNIDDLEKHFFLRKKLYETLGLRSCDFYNKTVVEIGPGGGYNTLYTASLKPKFYQLIEPNSAGIEELKENLSTHKLLQKNIDIQNVFLEEFTSEKCFDIAICEGMLPCVKNNHALLKQMDKLLKTDGVMLITCSDEISIFFDMARRLLANILLQRENLQEFQEQVKALVTAFGPHLDTLKGFGRLKEDWCADNLLGNALYNTNLSVSDVIELFEDRYSFYKISPQIILDPTWFKETPRELSSFNRVKKEHFEAIWHNLLHYQCFDTKVWEKEATDQLRALSRNFIQCTRAIEEQGYDSDTKDATLHLLSCMQALLRKNSADDTIIDAIDDLIRFLEKNSITKESIAHDLSIFKSAFGRGQQYISLIKEY